MDWIAAFAAMTEKSGKNAGEAEGKSRKLFLIIIIIYILKKDCITVIAESETGDDPRYSRNHRRGGRLFFWSFWGRPLSDLAYIP
ncbi:hypothetical protein [Luteithermobacter gelatinilyticus]|uniref:hypothetical protein n=1 Tax=Luteithermobacter gelatinilyticus TaxID=2582913 RepID=UPI0011062578|nr:hypothetical protein [Luteithermobacter gelatinilyticus]